MHDLIKKARELVEANPDFVYTSPDPSLMGAYVHDGQPSCLFGQAAHAIGYSLDRLAEYESLPAAEMADRIGIRLTADEGYWADMVQTKQDTGFPWGSAVEIADRKVEL